MNIAESIAALIAAQRLYPAERRSLADALETIAATQRRLADADERMGHVIRRATEETAPKKATGRPKGSGGAFIRWIPADGRSGDLCIAPKLWRDMGSPERIDVQRIDGRLWLRPCRDPDGYKVSIPTGPRGGMPHMAIGQGNADIFGLTEGRIPAEIRDGAIVTTL